MASHPHSKQFGAKRRRASAVSLAALLALLTCGGCTTLDKSGERDPRANRGFVVYDDEAPLPFWVVPADAEPSLRRALSDADRLLRTMGGRTGVEPGRNIHLVRSADLRDQFPEGRGFVIQVEPSRVTVRAVDDAGLRQGVLWMLQEWTGVRWFWPQSVGEEVPERRALVLPEGTVRKSPAYLSRDFFAAGPQGLGERWEERNLMEERYSHQHGLDRVFPATLREREPHLFPLIEGQRVRPERFLWQPNLAHPDAVEQAAAVATGWLRLSPASNGITLSINDSMRFDEGPETAAIQQPLRWFRGRPDYSPLVFGFMNRVAERIPQEVLRDRTLGAYAYYWTENTPPFAVHRSVMPVLTADRFQYYDRQFRDEDLDLIERWGRSGAGKLMLYEYFEGDAYFVPRQAPEALAASIRTGHASGAKGYFAESRLWPGMDGPKSWVVARLLWDPKLDVRKLEEEFAEGMFGEDAAGAYLAYLRTGESIWQAQPGTARWLRGYHDEFQGILLPPSARIRLARAHQRFQQAVEKSVRHLLREGRTKRAALIYERAQVVARAHELCDTMVEMERTRRQLSNLEQRVRLENTAEAKVALRAAARAHDLLQARLVGLAQDAFSRGELNHVPSWINRSSPAARAAAALQGWEDDAALAINDNPSLSKLRSPGPAERTRLNWFQQHAPLLPVAWRMDVRPAQGFAIQHDQTGPLQNWRIEAADGVRLSQRTPVTPGQAYRAAARVSGTLEFGTEATLQLEFLDRDRNILGPQPIPDRMELGRVSPGSGRLVCEGVAPTGAVWAVVSFHVRGQASRASPGDPAADSVVLHQIGLWHSQTILSDSITSHEGAN